MGLKDSSCHPELLTLPMQKQSQKSGGCDCFAAVVQARYFIGEGDVMRTAEPATSKGSVTLINFAVPNLRLVVGGCRRGLLPAGSALEFARARVLDHACDRSPWSHDQRTVHPLLHHLYGCLGALKPVRQKCRQ